MRVGIIGAGHIGGNIARQAPRSGHDVMPSFARDAEKLQSLGKEVHGSVGTAAEVVTFGEVVVISVPWLVLPQALEQAGSLARKIVVDTTNQYGSGPLPANGQTGAAFNKARMPGALYTKCFNTL